MNRKLKYILPILFIMLVIDPIAKAEAPSPGSVDDPVITKSYFDRNTLTEEKVKQLISAANTSQGNTGGSSTGNGATPSGSLAITVIQLKASQTLYAGAGAEFIVRTGKVLAVSNDENGIPDVTGGKDLPAGIEVALNHLLIFPTEGRGIKPSPKNTADIFVMVRGSYLLLNADGSPAAQ
jgi:hypothetical protein